MNHAIGDRNSFWHFFNTFSEIFQSQQREEENHTDFQISRPPILNRWIPEGYDKIVNLPFTDLDQFLSPFESPLLKERMFLFSSDAIATLKQKDNSELNTLKISSLQALSAFLWRCITRIRRLPENQVTSCRVACNDRSRLNPPLSQNYFGNCIHPLRAFTTAGELLKQNLGWATWKVHEAVIDLPPDLMTALKFSGKVTPYPGREGGGSMELEICLPLDLMTALESDHEFMQVFSHI